ncbi:glycosyltransferase [Sulfitobacter sp. S190]|uniref:glycosyltransferase n=1 Tax=Sulfitobacter sp. S190 TaxID=2867022 RepID=UPI0021A457E3|nr:glycosyltransferase [Sulfitobacter sp. S190]UWR24452.1 glycosyltransferase [Sulfitobacter sp. S190]
MLLIRAYRVFQYYATETARVEMPGRVLRDRDGHRIGAIDRIAIRVGRLVVEGHCVAERVALSQGGAEVTAIPQSGEEAPFHLDLPYAPGPARLLVTPSAQEPHSHTIAGVSPLRLRIARALRALPFIATLIRMSPVIWRWKRSGDLGARERVKEALHLVPPSPSAVIDGAVLTGAVPPLSDPGRYTIVMPVYNALEVTRQALERVVRHSSPGWRLVVVEDASTDPDVRPWLRAWASDHTDRVTLLFNETNLGFIGATNRGLERARLDAPDAPVVLLNSDALVPETWAERLLAPLCDPAVASVTPFSNDAEIFTVPAISQRHDLRPDELDLLAKHAAGLAPATSRPALPTGVGFCMALSPRYLEKIPQFDTVFGRGYGEEVDWCRKAIQAGGSHVAATDLFVEHRGGASFGSAEKQRLLQRNAAVISQRYASFDAEVRAVVGRDPLVAERLALGLSMAAERATDAVPVWLAHAMGGGAQSDLETRIAARTDAGAAGVVLRVGRGFRWVVELHTPQGVTVGNTDQFADVMALVGRLPKRRIIYACGVGDRDPAALPDLLLRLAGRAGNTPALQTHPVEVLMHDYFPISPSYTLLGDDGMWHGVPLAGGPLASDRAHTWRDPAGIETDLARWQDRWGVLMRTADRIEVFSRSSRDIVLQAYPECAQTIVVQPHRLPAPPPRLTDRVKAGDTPVIGVLGNIGAHKGAGVLSALSRNLARSGRARIVVIGRLAPEYTLARPSRVHGRYRVEDLPALVSRYGITAWMIPSIWPETFSFTTHEALATGLPVIAFDLGAQGAAVRAAANGVVLPCPGSDGVDIDALHVALRTPPE